MLDPAHFDIIAGEWVVKAMNKEIEMRVPMTGSGRHSDSLVKVQQDFSQRGYLGVEIVCSLYGHSVRADSGLQGFALLAGKRLGNVDGSYESAEAWAKAWAAQDPSRRYVWKRKGK